VHSNDLCTHNGNIETQSLVDIGDEVSSLSSELENHCSGYSDTLIKEGGAELAPSACHTFLQRREGHFCTICHEKHFLPETELATLDTACDHVFCYRGLKQWKMNNAQTLQFLNCMCQARKIYCHKYTTLDFTSNKPISQEFLQIQDNSTNETAHPASICVQTQNYSSKDPAPPELKWCDWDMGSFSHTGHDTPHQEQCFSFGMRPTYRVQYKDAPPLPH
jgi:hypothetical protein